jgi:hypothetical protein
MLQLLINTYLLKLCLAFSRLCVRCARVPRAQLFQLARWYRVHESQSWTKRAMSIFPVALYLLYFDKPVTLTL